MYFTMCVDSNDIEGIAFRDYSQSTTQLYCDSLSVVNQVNDPVCWHAVQANPNDWAPIERLGGRPIGFDFRMGLGPEWGANVYGEYVEQLVAL